MTIVLPLVKAAPKLCLGFGLAMGFGGGGPRLRRRWRGPSLTVPQPNLNMCARRGVCRSSRECAAQWPKLKSTSVSFSQRWFAQRR